MSPQCCIITIGDELLMGQTIDTNSAWLAKELNEIGIRVKHRVAVGDVADDIREALNDALSWAQLVLITGGLGPTSDDITKPLLCDFFGGKLVEDEAVKKHVVDFFEKRNRPILASNVAQAMVPDVCEILFNNVGTAPGMLFQKGETLIASLPGVPFEMKFLYTERLRELLITKWTVKPLLHRHILTSGEGESFVAERLRDFEMQLPAGIKLAYLPDLSLVKLRLSAEAHLAGELDYAQRLLSKYVAPIMVYAGDHKPEEALRELMLKHGLSLALAESCTGGHIAARITSVSGASQYFVGGYVPYSVKAKENVVGVSGEHLQQFTAVSQVVATDLALNTQTDFQADYALSVTGYLEKGDHENEVWIGIVGPKHQVITKKINVPYDREKNTLLVVNTALTLLYNTVNKLRKG